MGQQGRKKVTNWKQNGFNLLNQLVLLLCEAFNSAASQGGRVEQSPHLDSVTVSLFQQILFEKFMNQIQIRISHLMMSVLTLGSDQMAVQ